VATGSGMFCDKPVGDCDGLGVCRPRPEACITLWDPVCGCDGRTYGNSCEAAAAGVSVAARGWCACPTIICLPGTTPADGDGDGCFETCRAPCEDACDCASNAGIEFSVPCPLMCPNCGNYWECGQGWCLERCGMIPPEFLDCLVAP
jgi:hypothetical protein